MRKFLCVFVISFSVSFLFLQQLGMQLDFAALQEKVATRDYLNSSLFSFLTEEIARSEMTPQEVRALIIRERVCRTPDYKHLQDISVKVDNGMGCGTGVLFTRDILGEPGLQRVFIWTAAHVVDNLLNDDGSYREATIRMESRVRGEFINEICLQAKIIALGDCYNGYDLALLEITEDCGTFPSAEFAGSEILPVGTELIHVGCCHAMEDSVSHGIISQTDRNLWKDGRMYDQTSCPVYPGSSGGGVYTLDGKCVGLVTNGLPGLNFFVPVRRMRAWAEEEGVEWALDRNVLVPLTRAPTRFEEETWPLRENDSDVIPSV